MKFAARICLSCFLLAKYFVANLQFDEAGKLGQNVNQEIWEKWEVEVNERLIF